MTPADKDALVARARSLATPVANCVAAGIPPAHLIGEASWHELYALVLVLADAADPYTLRIVAEASDDGPEMTGEDDRLREAHRQAERLRRAGHPVPLLLRVADGEYHARRKALRERDAKVLAGGRDEQAA